jgi:phenylalanyl-tRNA synthetase beta chain
MTADQEYLRPNLRANLLTILCDNRRYEDGGIRLFELGRVYLPHQKNLPEEPEVLCGILSGPRLVKSWHSGGDLLDFFDAKGVIEGLLSQLGVEASFEEGSDESLHPSKQAALVIAGNRLGVIGELHHKVTQAFEAYELVYLFEIDLTALLPFTTSYKMFQPIPRFPATVRDLALVINIGITHKRVQDIIKGFPLVNQVAIFDVYAGEQVPPDKKSLAYRITFQSTTHTLTDEEVNSVQQQILDKLSSELGATLRS